MRREERRNSFVQKKIKKAYLDNKKKEERKGVK